MTSPYRERPRVLFCPRCNVLLDMFDPGVEVCPRCEGVWLARSVLDVSGARWPAGPQAWWRNELECPDCLVDGTRTTMGARTSGELIVDQCPAHGVWLDRGELARIMTAPGAHGAQALRERFSAVAPTPEQLVVRRERWRAEQEQRRLAAEQERQRLEDELARRAAAEEAARHQKAEVAAERRLRLERAVEEQRLREARKRAEQAAAERTAAEGRAADERAAAQRPGLQRTAQYAADHIVTTLAADERRAARADGLDSVPVVEQRWDAAKDVLGIDPFEKPLDQLKADRVAATQALRALEEKLTGLRAEVADTEIAVLNAWRRLDRIEGELERRDRVR